MSLVLAADYRVADFDRWWSAVTRDLSPLTRLRVHHLVVYRSLEDPNRVFVTIGVHERGPLEAVLRSPDVLTWFAESGVEDVPPLFAGEVVEKLDMVGSGEEFVGSTPVVVAGIVPIPDFDRFWERLQTEVQARRTDVLRLWTYRAFDDPNEVMILQEIPTEPNLSRWQSKAGAIADWMSQAGVGVYPPMFIGRLVESIVVPDAAPAG